jgi:putative CocE/NonD family hydrolase
MLNDGGKMSDMYERTWLGGVTVERDVPATMRDGVILLADVYRPADDGEFPVLLQRTPYDKTVAQQISYRHPVWYARHGYIVVVQDTRGRYNSGGEFEPFFTEGEDTADSIAWAARIGGSDGRVATYGFSYAGAVQLLGAIENPESLVCMVPSFTGSDFFDGWTYVGGAFSLAFIVSWVQPLLAIPDLIKRNAIASATTLAHRSNDFPGLYSTQPLGEFPLLRDVGAAPYFFDWLEHDTRDDYWKRISIRDRHDKILTPGLHFGGWYDTFVEGTIENFCALAALAEGDQMRAQRLVIGPWKHIPWTQYTGSVDFGDSGRNIVDDLQVSWFNYWLKGEGNLSDWAPLRLFRMGDNKWCDYDAWPPSNASEQKYFLRSSGSAMSLSGDGTLMDFAPGEEEPSDVFVFIPSMPAPSAGGRSCCVSDVAPIGPMCQTHIETRNDVLIYSTPPLVEDLEVVGTIVLVLYAATDAVDTDWTAKICDVDTDGRSINLCDGIIRARYRESLEHPTFIEPKKIYEYRIKVGSTANLFKRGHRIRLEISSSNFPMFDVNPNNGQRTGEATTLAGRVATQVVFHDALRPSHLIIPVVGIASNTNTST